MMNRIFTENDGTFITGVNYWASHAATAMWTQWDEDVVDRDMAALAEHGAQVLRVFPLWPDFQPIVRLYQADGKGVEYRFGEAELPDTPAGRAGVSELMMVRFERLADLAVKHHLSLAVALLTGHMTGRLFMPPGLAGLNPVNHPEALLWEVRFVKYFVARMRNHPAIAAWEYGNECNYFGKTKNAAEAAVWMALIGDAVKLSDPDHPLVSGMNGHSVANDCWSVQHQAEQCDILTTHHYTMWRSGCSDPLDSIKATLFAVGQNRIYRDIGGRPCFMEETGSWRAMAGDLGVHAAYLRNLYWNLWANRGDGLLWWCGFDQDHIRTAPYDWDFAGLEHGMFNADRQPLPAAVEMRKFRKFLDELPFDRLPAALPDAICLLGDERQDSLNVGVGAFILARQAGFELEFQHARQPLRDAAMYLLPSACGKAGMSGKNWAELRKRVSAGATLYLSIDDVYLDHLGAVFQAETHTRSLARSNEQYVFQLGDEELRLEFPGQAIRNMRSLGAEVLGENENGNPVFFSGHYGKGKVFLLSFPLEKLMMEQPGMFHNSVSADAWRLYRHLAKTTRRRVLEKRHPFLGLSEHHRTDQETIIVAVNNSADSLVTEADVCPGWTMTRALSSDGSCESAGDKVTLSLPGNSGAVLMFRKID